MKPTTGRSPHRGNTDPDTRERPISRRVVDAALMLDATVRPHPWDRFALPSARGLYTEATTADGDLAGIRIAAGFDRDQGPIAPQTRRALSAALDDLRAAGAVAEEVPVFLSAALRCGPDRVCSASGPGHRGPPPSPRQVPQRRPGAHQSPHRACGSRTASARARRAGQHERDSDARSGEDQGGELSA
ncbi:amidase family protein [Streptomyces vietnamensis]|uniref:amidase family protein n=1 Tax=Streptomyces vietnamensis TaxID=362257 RepID=UPI003CCBA194